MTQSFVSIDGKLINPAHVVSAEIDTRHYMNGSSSYLVVRLADGQTMRREHGLHFDAFAAYDKLKAALP